ncbi:hypothetical protein BGZ51_006355 [Haplosporangium sp. Z 767]|nr:hypothetical protein BGZ50_006508 [Haplosporangium sp. Z 11]KAF9180214.1 hypothetical protein BGZ51_006355 [Haplosporangium sp. Z 767]
MIIKETTLDHLYGASWIQLTWIYIKLDCGDDKSRSQAKPFTYSKLTNGLRISIRDSVGGFARRLLTRHLEEILIWLWKHEWLHSDETLRVSNDLILEMMMIWIMDYFPSVLSHRPVLKDGAKTLFEDAFRVLVYEDEQSLLEERLLYTHRETAKYHNFNGIMLHQTLHQALLQIEIIHTDDQLKSRLPILEKLTTTVRLLTIYAEFDKSKLG